VLSGACGLSPSHPLVAIGCGTGAVPRQGLQLRLACVYSGFAPAGVLLWLWCPAESFGGWNGIKDYSKLEHTDLDLSHVDIPSACSCSWLSP
jgi:hypothetical protein